MPMLIRSGVGFLVSGFFLLQVSALGAQNPVEHLCWSDFIKETRACRALFLAGKTSGTTSTKPPAPPPIESSTLEGCLKKAEARFRGCLPAPQQSEAPPIMVGTPRAVSPYFVFMANGPFGITSSQPLGQPPTEYQFDLSVPAGSEPVFRLIVGNGLPDGEGDLLRLSGTVSINGVVVLDPSELSGRTFEIRKRIRLEPGIHTITVSVNSASGKPGPPGLMVLVLENVGSQPGR